MNAGMNGHGPLIRFLLLVLAALALQGIPLLYTLLEGDAGVIMYLAHLYVLLPLMAAVLPFRAARGGVHPLAAFFPIGLALLLLPVYQSPGMGLACMAVSLVAAVAGQEWEKRKTERKGNPYGGK